MAQDAALLRALRAATTSTQRGNAVSAVLDRLATTTSVPETQRLLDALWDTPNALSSLLPPLKQVASVCSAPPRKAACVGHTLVERLVAYVVSTARNPEALRVSQEMLLSIYQANSAIAVGVLSAIESVNTNADDTVAAVTTLAVTRPLLIAALIESSRSRAVQKLALVQTLVRTAWSSAADTIDLRTPIAHVLVRAVQLSPLTTDEDLWTVYPALVASTIDLVTSDTDASAVAHAILRRISFGLTHDLGVVSLLQSLKELVTAYARVLCTSSIVFQLGAVLLHPQSAGRTQLLVLQQLRELLTSLKASSSLRTVYVEALVVPLVAVQATHPQDAPALLQLVLDAASRTPFQSVEDPINNPALGVDAAHAWSFLAVVASPEACEAWLESLFLDKNPEIQEPTSTLLIQLGACLIDRRGRIRLLVLEALDRQLQLRRVYKNADWTPSSVKLLVSTFVILTSYRPATASITDQPWLSRSFQVLASLAATTTETMKIILRLIKRMPAATPRLQPQALHLLLLVWKQDSRVYPQLEALLHQAKDAADEQGDQENDDAEIVRMATILALCEKDPETGVEWIADVQRFLEHSCVSIVAMAVQAIALLCTGDCLDYETTIKIVLLKIKKHKIACADDPLFQQALCQLYAIGGVGGFVDSSPKYSARVLADLWEFTNAEDASVRVAAFVALNSYTLAALGMRLSDSAHTQDKEDEEEDEEEEDRLTEHDVEENLERVWKYLQTESNERVRVEIETLVKRILDDESQTLAPGGARRTGTGVAAAAAFAATEQRVSTAATKDLKKVLPTRPRMVEHIDQAAAWCAYLLAYEPANVVDTSAAAKRKDKRLRVIMGHVDEMEAVLAQCLASSTASWISNADEAPTYQFLQLLQSIDGWNAFARKYFSRLEELALLRTPMDAPDGHTAGVLNTLLTEQLARLVDVTTHHRQKWLVVGALVHQACLAASSELLHDAVAHTRTALRAQLLQSIEELRVFKTADHAVDVQYLLLGLVLAYPTTSDPSLDAIVARVLPLGTNEYADSMLLQAAAVLFVSHASSLVQRDESRATQRQRLEIGIQCAGTALLRPLCGASAAGGIAAKLYSVAFDAQEVAVLAKNATSTVTSSRPNTATTWAAAIGLAQLASQFAAVHRLAWLDHVRLLLENVWESEATLVGAIALGPVVLESVFHNRVSITAVQEFASILQRRIDVAPNDVTVVGAVVLPFVLQRIGTFAHVGARTDLAAFLQSLASVTGASAMAPLLAVAAGNLLHGSTGVTLFSSTTACKHEVAMETASVERLITALDRLSTLPPLVSTAAAFARGAIADRADTFEVVQKNKTVDVQLSTLPATSLVFKTLDFLRTDEAAAIEALPHIEAKRRMSVSALWCLAHASRSCPLPLDLSTLVIRVCSRYAYTDDVLVAGIELAASHASGVSLLMTTLLTPARLLNYSPRVVAASVEAVVTARHRLTSPQLTTLLTRTFDALVDSWRQRDDRACQFVSSALATWITFVGTLVESPPSEEGQQMDAETEPLHRTLETIVLRDLMPKLPFTPEHDTSKALLRQFAHTILAKLTDRTAVTDTLLSSPSHSDGWAWWRIGSLLLALLRLGTIATSSTVFRWLLQLDLSGVDETSTSVLDAFITDMVEAVHVAAGTKSSIEVNEPWLLELLDGIERTAGGRKRRVLFAAVERVVAWPAMRGHETFMLTARQETITGSMPALAAHALMQHHNAFATRASASLAHRLWTQESQELEVVHAQDTIVRELFVLASFGSPKGQLLSVDMERALVAQLSSRDRELM